MNLRKLNVFLAVAAVIEIAAYIYVVNNPHPKVLGAKDEAKLNINNISLPKVSSDLYVITDSAITPIAYSLVEATTPKLTPTPTIKPQIRVAAVSIARITPTPVAVNYTTPFDIQSLIVRYAAEYGVESNMMIRIAKCESGFRADAVNGPYAGIYQFVTSTWVSNRNAMGLDPDPNLRFNAEESIRTAAFKMGRDGYGAWPTCSRS